MTAKEQAKAAAAFAERWAGKGDEKGQSQQFWMDLLVSVYGVQDIAGFIRFEDRVKLDHTSFIDGYIESTRVMIEQKSLGKDLRKAIKQSDGSMLSPFQQAKRYVTELPVSKHPRWIVTCNFAEFHVYDMEKPNGDPEIILLKDLGKDYYRLQFLVEAKSETLKQEMELSLQAGEIVGVLYDAFQKQYANPTAPETLKSLNKLCVRLVFCLYAEDSGIFDKHLMFHDYMKRFPARDARKALIELFKVLDMTDEQRKAYDPYMDDDLAAFHYVNGGLFADEDIEIPRLTDEIMDLILRKASEDFNWAGISPTIFGAVFESTLNPETRRSGGMHYTSIENIHKVTDPLFLDALREELDGIKALKEASTRRKRLEAFQEKLASLCFLDPACGSGNFLTETYISLRRLENETVYELIAASKGQVEGQMMLTNEGILNPIKMSIGQFYGIEINDFAVAVAKTALWIAESQMMQETERMLWAQGEQVHFDFLPLKSYANIVEGNALRLDWASVVPREKLSYIIGNPPFVGYSLQSKSQKEDMLSIYVDEKGKPYKTAGKIDYVAGWYFKAAALMDGTEIRTAFVSTNSITQGEQVAGVWKPLYDRFGIHIDFAYQTFKWDNRGEDEKGNKKKTDDYMATVHVVVIGFSSVTNSSKRKLYSANHLALVDQINAYLIVAPSIFIDNRTKPICNVPEMQKGSIPVDDGHFFLTTEERDLLIQQEPQAQKYIKRFLGAREFLHSEERWCLWLVDVSPAELKKMPQVLKRVQLIKHFRLKSTKAATRKYADYPYKFMEIRQPKTDYILVPSHSSENRKYIPIGFESSDVVCGNANLLIPNASLYEFGILTSNVHMAWVSMVCGRLEMDLSRMLDTFPFKDFNNHAAALNEA